jgi:DNA topoisomerase II
LTNIQVYLLRGKMSKKETVKNEPPKRTLKMISMRDHILTKSMWAGSKQVVANDYYIMGAKQFELKSLEYPPVLLKLLDEILVNAIDQHTTYPELVNKIDIELDEKGYISVSNNGPGITVEKTKNLNGVEMYSVQMIFSEFLSGSNLDNDETRIVGGTNGLGAKLTAVFSDEFIVETVDLNNKLYYKQVFEQGLLKINEPTILSLSESKLSAAQKKGMTKITFLPRYSEFKIGNKSLTSSMINKTLHDLIRSRVYLAAVGSNIKFKFNKEDIYYNNFNNACGAFFEEKIITCEMVNTKTNTLPWKVGFGLSDGKARQISIVNGLVVMGGPHFQHIQNCLTAALKPKIEKEIKNQELKFNKNTLLNNFFIIMTGNIPNINPDSQTKETFAYDIKKFAPYDIPSNTITSIWTKMKEDILSGYLTKTVGTKTRTNRNRIDASKFMDARKCRDSKEWVNCCLIITEGDSASGTANAGLVSKKTSPNFNYDFFGVYSIQGVSVNGLKASIEVNKKKKPRTTKKKTEVPEEEADPEEVFEESDSKIIDVPTEHVLRKPKKLVLNNKRLATLFHVLNLDFNKTYETEKEWNTLRYGSIAALVDQDLDGFNIFGLIATLILTYWPELVRRGFVRRINTPLIRYYPKNKKNPVKEFYTEKQAQEWIETIGEDSLRNTYKLPPNYYKGLGSHNPRYGEVDSMFRNIDNKICTYILDAKAIESMYIYYGSDSKPRKIVLATPVSYELTEGLQIPLSQHFHVDTKLFQRDNILRKLIHAIDGFISSRRKVFFTARKKAQHDIKVAALAALVASDANYHHSEGSVENTIVGMAQAFKGARCLPLLLPIGNFGTRDYGFKNYAASRYIYTRINTKLVNKLFRREDEYILQYELEDGERYEPKYYVPIIPYSICESNELPGTGWRVKLYARELSSIFENIRDMISGKIKQCKKLPLSKLYNTRRDSFGKLYFVGDYTYDSSTRTITITELPPNVCSKVYLFGVEKSESKKAKDESEGIPKKGIIYKEYVEDYKDETDHNGIHIELTIKPGAFEEIEKKYAESKYTDFDSFEEYFDLKTPVVEFMNLVNEHDEVVEYKSYEDIFNDWFTFRKDLYAVRIDREILLNDLELLMLKNQQMFSKNHVKYNITSKTDIARLTEILSENKYSLINKSLLDSPKYTELNLLKEYITEPKHGACYNYLIDMGYRDLTEESYNKRDLRIKEIETRQMYLKKETGSFKGAKIWELELNELEQAIKEGQSTDWFYGENIYIFDDATEAPKKTKARK